MSLTTIISGGQSGVDQGALQRRAVQVAPVLDRKERRSEGRAQSRSSSLMLVLERVRSSTVFMITAQ